LILKNEVNTLLIICSTYIAFGQSSIGLKLSPVGFHPFGINQDPLMFENKVTSNGSLIVEPGYQFNFQKFIHLTVLSLEIRQGIHSDAAAKRAGHIGLGLRWKFFHMGKHSVSISASPIYAYRENWKKISQYVENDGYIDNGKYQYKFLVGSELVYNFYLGKRSDINLALTYNNSRNTLAVSIGYRHWINPYVNIKDRNCNSCAKRWSKGRMRKWWRKVWR
jgi:hypothetical protein